MMKHLRGSRESRTAGWFCLLFLWGLSLSALEGPGFPERLTLDDYLARSRKLQSLMRRQELVRNARREDRAEQRAHSLPEYLLETSVSSTSMVYPNNLLGLSHLHTARIGASRAQLLPSTGGQLSFGVDYQFSNFGYAPLLEALTTVPAAAPAGGWYLEGAKAQAAAPTAALGGTELYEYGYRPGVFLKLNQPLLGSPGRVRHQLPLEVLELEQDLLRLRQLEETESALLGVLQTYY